MKNNKPTNSRREYICGMVIVACIILIAAIAIIVLNEVEDDDSSATRISFIIKYENETSAINLWFVEEKDVYYLFLPSFAEVNEVEISCGTSYTIEIGSCQYNNSENLSDYEFDKEYAISCLDKKGDVVNRGTIVFMKSANVPAMIIDTESGGMDYVHADKDNKEAGTMRLITEDGNIEYNSGLNYIKGRGHLSWVAEKKPYNISLSEENDLLSMGKASDWCLIANNSDTSNMRNQIVYDFARDIGFANSPDSEYVDLYLNGEYSGLYLLTGKAEIGEYRIDINNLEEETQRINKKELNKYAAFETNESKGYFIENNPINNYEGYLLELDLSGRFKEEPSWIITDNDQSLTIKSPKYASVEQVEYIGSFLREFEEALYSDTGVNSIGKSYIDYIDVESWAMKYLIEEVFANQDTEWSSQFFYIASEDDKVKLYAGPLWDYDISLGNTYNVAGINPRTLIALWRGEYKSQYLSWYSELYKKTDFYTCVTTLYCDRFKPRLDKLLDTGLKEHGSYIALSAVMNDIRWYNEPQIAINDEQAYLFEYINSRVDFLDSLWIDHESYYTVSFNGLQNNIYYRYSIPRGQTVEEIPASQLYDYIFEGWYYEGTDILFDKMQPITSETTLYAKWTEKQPLKSFIKRYFTILIFLTIIGAIAILVFIENHHKRRGTRGNDEIL